MKFLMLNIFFMHILLGYDYKLKSEKINTTTYCFFGKTEAMDRHNNGNMVNSCYVNMGNSYLVIDSGPTYQYAQQTYLTMKEIEDLPISYVINTHAHDDHWLGNSYYKEIGVDIVGTEGFEEEAKVEKTRMEMRISEDAFKGTTQVFPNIFVHKKKTLMVNGKKVYITCVNKKAHSNSDLFVYIPKYSTLFAGDLVFTQRIPSLRDANIINWMEALEKIKAMNAQYLIGGHGSIVDKNSFESTHKYLSILYKKVSQAIENGDSLEDTVNQVAMDEFRNFDMYKSVHRRNVEATYRNLEWEE